MPYPCLQPSSNCFFKQKLLQDLHQAFLKPAHARKGIIQISKARLIPVTHFLLGRYIRIATALISSTGPKETLSRAPSMIERPSWKRSLLFHGLARGGEGLTLQKAPQHELLARNNDPLSRDMIKINLQPLLTVSCQSCFPVYSSSTVTRPNIMNHTSKGSLTCMPSKMRYILSFATPAHLAELDCLYARE